MSNSFLDSPSFRKITTPTQRKAVERSRRSSGRRGSGRRDDPIRRETKEDIQNRERAENLQLVQRQLSEKNIRLTQAETEAILRGETPQTIISQVNQRLEQESTTTTPAQRFVETGQQRIAVSDAFASKVDEGVQRGDFERIAREERIGSLASSTPDKPISRFSQTSAGRFVSGFREPFVDPARTTSALRTGDSASPEQAGRAIGFTFSAATTALGGIPSSASAIPFVQNLRFRTGQATGFLTRPVSRLAPSLGLTTERSRRIASITTTTAGTTALAAEPVFTARTRILSGESTLGEEVSRTAPSLVIQAGAARALFGTGFRGGFKSGQDVFDTTIPTIPSRQVTTISPERTTDFFRPTPRTRVIGERISIRPFGDMQRRFVGFDGRTVRTEPLPFDTRLTGRIDQFTGLGRATEAQTTLTFGAGTTGERSLPFVRVTPEASMNILASRTRPAPTEITLSQYLSTRPRPASFERGLDDFFLELRAPTPIRGVQPSSTISTSQLGIRDLGEGLPGFSLSRAPRTRSFTNNVVPRTENIITSLVTNKKGQFAVTRTIPKSPLSEFGKISSLNQRATTRLGRDARTMAASRTRTIPLFAVIPRFQFATASASAFRASTDLGTGLDTGLRSVTSSISGTRTIQGTTTTTKSITSSISGTPTSPTQFFPPSSPSRPVSSPIKPPKALASFDLSRDELFGKTASKKKQKERGFGFTPSITGAAFKIKQTGSKATTGFTGLELRGI